VRELVEGYALRFAETYLAIEPVPDKATA